MSSQVTKVRFVYCPRCRRLLTEFSDIPVYKCGGCGTVLEAKNRSGGGEGSASKTLDKTHVKANEGHNFENNISDTSSEKEILSSTDSNVSDMDCERERAKSIARNSNVISSSDVLKCRKEDMSEKNPVEEKKERHSSEASESVAFNKQEVLCSTETCVSDMNYGRERVDSADYGNNLSYCRRNSNTISSAYVLDCHEEDSPGAGENGEESNGNDRRYYNSKSPKHESQLTFMERSSQKQPEHTIQSKIENSYLNEKSQNLDHCGYENIRPRDKIEGTTKSVGNNIVSEEDMADTDIIGPHRDFSKSQTNRTSQAYDGSASSNGYDYDDDVRHQHPHPSARTSFKSKRVPQSFINKSNFSEVQPQVRKAALMSSNDSYCSGATGGINWNRNEPSTTPRYGFEAQERGSLQESDIFKSVWNWMDSEKEGSYRSRYREPQYQRDPTNVYYHQNGSLSNYGREELLRRPNSHASDKLRYLDYDRLNLLRKVDELSEKLSRSNGEREKARERFPVRDTQQESHWPLRHHNGSEQEFLQRYSTNNGWHSPGAYSPSKGRPQQCKPLQMPFSGLATNYRQHVDNSFMHSYPEDQQYPVQFPPCICYNKGLCGACPGHICYHSHSSNPASSRRLTEYSQLHEQRRMDHEIEMLLYKEKRNPKKRHFLRPVAGGAPFVVCYSCMKLLQLPADFLLSRRRRHKLQCGACSEVLTFWLHDRTHVFPYNSTSQVQNPPVEVDNVSDTAMRNLAYASHVDRVSYSDDYGLSFCKSYSTEIEPSILAPPFPIPQNSGVDKRYASDSSQESMDGRKKKTVSDYPRPNSQNSRQLPGSVIPFPDVESVKTTFDANVVAPINSSPLHRLMGYSSPGEMINSSRVRDHEPEGGDIQTVENSYASNKENGMSSPMHNGLESKALQFCNESEEDEFSEEMNTKDLSLFVFGTIDKVPRDLNHELGNMKLKVFVNGRVIPDQLVKKAEERAGPIQPGNYWYDSGTGFWGVMGQPCLGIIPPFIEEFNYPMTKECAGGNTSILVNGRELHQEDLDMLSYRGLPTTKNKAYIVKICGQVIDEDSGTELDSLGKLAPTVERLGQGFGMHVPY